MDDDQTELTTRPDRGRRFHDENGVPTPTSAAVIVIVVPFLVALAMFAGFLFYVMS